MKFIDMPEMMGYLFGSYYRYFWFVYWWWNV